MCQEQPRPKLVNRACRPGRSLLLFPRLASAAFNPIKRSRCYWFPSGSLPPVARSKQEYPAC
ncbi:hypothetical protein ZHAS_00019865 [Anopheles sinensis]|uniref:Uncharacterized protein n=1 Tax=Anopheles sinensis TaxID=74873 RepID=A0A084WMF1_ANOSI|nr:hypothetical protein ZHAS_00019865 [Anopheles sinensis]